MSKALYLKNSMVPSDAEMVRELLAWYALAYSRGQFTVQRDLKWYVQAHADAVQLQQKIADHCGFSLDEVIDAIAIVSPGTNWKVNVRSAEYALMAWAYNRDSLGGSLEERQRYFLLGGTGTPYGWACYEKLWAYLDAPLEDRHLIFNIGSEKTFSFADNIRNPHTSKLVTIDQHMVHILCRTKQKGAVNLNKHYARLARIIVIVANILGIPAHELQALVWACRVALFEAGWNVDDIYNQILNLEEVTLA